MQSFRLRTGNIHTLRPRAPSRRPLVPRAWTRATVELRPHPFIPFRVQSGADGNSNIWWNIALGGILLLVEYCSWWNIALGGILLLVEYCYWWNIALGGILLLVEYCSWWNTALGGILLLVEYCSWWNIALGGILLLVEFCSWWNIALGGIFLLVEYCSWWNIAIGGILLLVPRLADRARSHVHHICASWHSMACTGSRSGGG